MRRGPGRRIRSFSCRGHERYRRDGSAAETARALLEQGAKVALVDIAAEALAATKAGLDGLGEVIIVAANVTGEADVQRYAHRERGGDPDSSDFAAAIPAGRLAKPRDSANLVVLLGNEAGFVRGAQ